MTDNVLALNPASVGPGLSDLVLEAPGARRLVHSLAYQAPHRFSRRLVEVGVEVARAKVADGILGARLQRSQIRVHQPGGAPALSGGRRIALYVHYARSGRFSHMVCEQLALYRALGFDVVLATNAETIDEPSWRLAAAQCWQVVRRANVGLDFGCWRDAAALILSQIPSETPPDELLLVNDSVLGPIHPLGPLISRARALGEGVVGMTESRQGGVHLQSYFVLALGAAATTDTLAFLRQIKLSTAKWLIVQRGEFGLTRYLLHRGHRVAALFGYEAALDSIMGCEPERRYVADLAPQSAALGDAPVELRRTLIRWPLNPTSHLWRGLPRCMGFPFLKTELIRRNPGLLPGVADWPALVGEAAPCSTDSIRDHISGL
jgi:hypothetical protein